MSDIQEVVFLFIGEGRIYQHVVITYKVGDQHQFVALVVNKRAIFLFFQFGVEPIVKEGVPSVEDGLAAALQTRIDTSHQAIMAQHLQGGFLIVAFLCCLFVGAEAHDAFYLTERHVQIERQRAIGPLLLAYKALLIHHHAATALAVEQQPQGVIAPCGHGVAIDKWAQTKVGCLVRCYAILLAIIHCLYCFIQHTEPVHRSDKRHPFRPTSYRQSCDREYPYRSRFSYKTFPHRPSHHQASRVCPL